MRKIKMLLVILGFVSSFVFGQELLNITGFLKPGSDPDGFRGIKWGTDIRTLSGMKYFRTDGSYGGIEVYIRENDELKIGDATLERIEYVFWRGKFCAVGIYTKGFVNFDNLKQAVFEKFGRGEKNGFIEEYDRFGKVVFEKFWEGQKSEFIEEYAWFGKNTWMRLKYNKFSQEGVLYMCSQTITRQMVEYQKQKAKEGAEKGF